MLFQKSYVPTSEFHATEVYFTKFEIKKSRNIELHWTLKTFQSTLLYFYYKSSFCLNEMHFIKKNVFFYN